MDLSIRVNIGEPDAVMRTALTGHPIAGIVVEPISPTRETDWIPLREVGRASNVRIGLRINADMLRQPFALAWQLTRLQSATRKPLQLLVGYPGDAIDAADTLFALKQVRDIIDRHDTTGQPWLEPSRVRGGFWPTPRDPVSGAPPEVAVCDADLTPAVVMAAADAADWYVCASASPRRVNAARKALQEALADSNDPTRHVGLGAAARMLVAPSADDLDQRARQMLGDRLSGREVTAWLTRAHRRWVAGTPREVVRRMSELAGSGVEWLMLTDGLEAELMAAELIGDHFTAVGHEAVSSPTGSEPSPAAM